MKSLRPYQQTAIDESFSAWSEGAKNILLVMATGTGKTFVGANIIEKAQRLTGKKTLFLAHRSELIQQARTVFSQQGLQPVVEMAGETHFGTLYQHKVVVGSVQTCSQPKRLQKFDPVDYGLVIVDEAHHATASTYRRILDHFKNSRVLGLTATPFRHDKIGLKNVFQKVAFQYPIQEGINDGHLCRIESKSVNVASLHLENVQVVRGEFAEDEITQLLMQEETLQQMVVPTIELAENRPTIVFCSDVEHATAITECFNRTLERGKPRATLLHGSMNTVDRRESLNSYETGKAQFIVNCQVLTEGYDYPPTACVALFRPMRSLGMLAQMVGRGTRTYPGKANCLILDFVGAEDTVETVNVLDVLDGTVINSETKKLAKEYAAGGMDAIDALKEAKFQIAKLSQMRARMQARYKATASNMLALFGISSVKGLYGGELVTEKQAKLLKNNGIEVDKDFEKGEAMRLISEVIRRREAGLCTIKQARFLENHGVSNSWELTFPDASTRIGAIIGR
jgi:superfamily II DNA or RNA helicase